MNTPKELEELRENLAAIEHERWSDWQKWCHKVLRENCPSPDLEKILERWDKQIATPYQDLSEQEKQSDREQVDRYLHLITTYSNKQSRLARVQTCTDIWANFDIDIKKRDISSDKIPKGTRKLTDREILVGVIDRIQAPLLAELKGGDTPAEAA